MSQYYLYKDLGVKPCGARWGIRRGEKGAARLQPLFVHTLRFLLFSLTRPHISKMDLATSRIPAAGISTLARMLSEMLTGYTLTLISYHLAQVRFV